MSLLKTKAYCCRRHTYRNWRLRYGIERDENGFHALIDSTESDDEFFFSGDTVVGVQLAVERWFRSVVNGGQAMDLAKRQFRIDVTYPDIFLDVRDTGWGYHLTMEANRESIMRDGLVPNGTPDEIVLEASRLIDSLRPSSVPSWAARANAVYLSPILYSGDVSDFDRPDTSLLAARVPTDRAWVGSEGIGGFCLVSEEEGHPILDSERRRARRFARVYWNNAVPFAEYLTRTPRTTKLARRWGLDEILVFQPIPQDQVIHLGSWDKDGNFIETSRLAEFVKPEFRADYRRILATYAEVNLAYHQLWTKRKEGGSHDQIQHACLPQEASFA